MNKRVKINTPGLADELSVMDINAIKSGELYENCLFQNGTLKIKELEQTAFRHCKFVNIDVENSYFYQLDIVDSVFQNCNIANAEWIGAIIHRCLFDHVKLVGSNFADSTIKDVEFTHCINTYAAYNDANFTRVLFNETILDAAEFQKLTWKNIFFTNCTLNAANFSHTALKGLDLSTNQFENIIFSKELVEGAIIHPMQALAMCSGFGIQIEDGY